jgi:hypothetical protein
MKKRQRVVQFEGGRSFVGPPSVKPRKGNESLDRAVATIRRSLGGGVAESSLLSAVKVVTEETRKLGVLTG